jgi:hypothetical protein
MHLPDPGGHDMKIIAVAVALATGGLMAGIGDESPQYDLKTELTVSGTIVEINQVPPGKPLDGVYLKIKTKTDTASVYLAPVEFVKMLDFTFRKGEEIDVTGSKVNFSGDDLVLARIASVGKTLFTFRDAKGLPNWLWMKRAPIPTGL